jgi:uncharacterized phiE125 gp8 family phage protein
MNYVQDVQVTQELVMEPVTLTEAKLWMKIGFSDDDSVISGLITTARTLLEKHTGLSLGSKTIRTMIDVCDDWVDLPYGPVATITSVSEILVDGTTEALTVDDDYVLVNRRLRMFNPGLYSIVYTTEQTVPEGLKSDIYRLVAYMYQNRGIQFESEDSIAKFPDWNSLSANYYAKVVI